jgi:hypothetical protein
MKLIRNIFAVFIIVTVVSVSCKKEEVTPAVTTPAFFYLKFNFSHNIDGAAMVLDTVKYVNKAGNVYSVINFKYFICNMVLHKGNDSIIIDGAHYIDIANSTSCIYSPTQKIPNGSYDYISFIFGLDASKNKTDNFVNPPESNMAWPVPMGGGYHYMQLEGKFDSATVIKNYNAHTGALNHMPYYIPIRLSQSSFTANGTDVTVNLAMNINEWFENPNTYDFNIYGDSMMGNDTAQQVLQQNGMDVFSVSAIK